MSVRKQFPDYSGRRKDLRRHATLPEALLWRHLRSRTIEVLKFRRQQQIGHFIVDFYCSAAKLVVEIDGGQHYEPEAQRYDSERTASLDSRGMRVLRFANIEVLQELDGVIAMISEAVTPSP